MATCTLELYQNTKLRPEKNYIFYGGISYFLASKTKTTISDFQWQRPELEKKIKVNLAQSYSTIAYFNTKYDYLRIKYDEFGTDYYYFIIKYTQVAENTIELSLRMDTLNTFSYNPAGSGIALGNKNYRLSPKTLIKRQHKDRFDKFSNMSGTMFESSDHAATSVNYFISVSKLYEKYGEDTLRWYIGDDTPSSRNTNFIIRLVNKYGRLIGDPILAKNQFAFDFYSPTYLTIRYVNYSGVDTALEVHQGQYIRITFSQISSDVSDAEDLDNMLFNMMAYTDPMYLFNRKIDRYSENINTILFKKLEYPLIRANETQQWYMVLQTANPVVSDAADTEPIYVNPIRCKFYSDNGYSVSSGSASLKRFEAINPAIPKWVNSQEIITLTAIGTLTSTGQQYVIVGGTTYDFYNLISEVTLYRVHNNDNYFELVRIKKQDNTIIEFNYLEYIDIYGLNYGQVKGDFWNDTTTIWIGAGVNTDTVTSPKWEDVDLTDPKFIKAFAFPYPPTDFLSGETFTQIPDNYVTSSDALELSSIQKTEFKYQIGFALSQYHPQWELVRYLAVYNFSDNQDRFIEMESKLFNSDFYQPKFVYDSFSFTFHLENIDTQKWISQFDRYTLYVTYVVSKNLVSKFAFIFDTYICDRSTQDYENVLCVERNNEKALYNNAYINYIKSGGYSYDTKKASSQNAVNGVTSALSIIGSIASFASTPATGSMGIAGGVGLAITASTSIIRGIHTAQEQDRAIAQKINQAIIQGTSVQGNEDIDIFTAINGNKAKIVFYELSDIMKSAVYDLFYFCGYATNENGIPNIDSRILFNYVQAEIQYLHCGFDLVFAEDIKNKWAEGVTFIHKNASNVYYDPEALKENWESFFFEEVE